MKKGSNRIPRSLRSRARVMADFWVSFVPGESSSVTKKTRLEPKLAAFEVKMVFAANRTLAMDAPSSEGAHNLSSALSSESVATQGLLPFRRCLSCLIPAASGTSRSMRLYRCE